MVTALPKVCPHHLCSGLLAARSSQSWGLCTCYPHCLKQPLHACVLKSCNQNQVRLCDPVDCSPPGSSVHGILQARRLEWVATPFSRGSSQPRDRTQVSCTAGGFFTTCATRAAQNCFYPSVIVSPLSHFRSQPVRSSGSRLELAPQCALQELSGPQWRLVTVTGQPRLPRVQHRTQESAGVFSQELNCAHPPRKVMLKP